VGESFRVGVDGPRPTTVETRSVCERASCITLAALSGPPMEIVNVLPSDHTVSMSLLSNSYQNIQQVYLQ
jgi:hypothetical protein